MPALASLIVRAHTMLTASTGQIREGSLRARDRCTHVQPSERDEGIGVRVAKGREGREHDGRRDRVEEADKGALSSKGSAIDGKRERDARGNGDERRGAAAR